MCEPNMVVRLEAAATKEQRCAPSSQRRHGVSVAIDVERSLCDIPINPLFGSGFSFPVPLLDSYFYLLIYLFIFLRWLILLFSIITSMFVAFFFLFLFLFTSLAVNAGGSTVLSSQSTTEWTTWSKIDSISAASEPAGNIGFVHCTKPFVINYCMWISNQISMYCWLNEAIRHEA